MYHSGDKGTGGGKAGSRFSSETAELTWPRGGGGGGGVDIFPNLFRKENEIPWFVSNIFQTNSDLNIIDT